MNYDIHEKREDTLRQVKKQERRGCGLYIFIFTVGLYVAVSLCAYGNAKQDETSSKAPVDHFIDAVTWNY